MKILSFETSNSFASVAVMINDEIIAHDITKQSSQQAERLLDLIENCLKIANLSLNDLDLISITNGPGSFTGVRIALATALGLKMGYKGNVIALTNFQVLAWQARTAHPQEIAVILDARREQVFFQKFDHDLIAISEPKLLDLADLPNHLSADMLIVKDQIADAKSLAQASQFYWQNQTYHGLEPLYIRQPDVK